MIAEELFSINVRMRRVDGQVSHRVDGKMALYTLQNPQKRGNILTESFFVRPRKDYE
jgi:hypothetical protein